MGAAKKPILFTFEPNRSKIHGFYDLEDGEIYVNKRLSKTAQALTVVHEQQHIKCRKSKCHCWPDERLYWCEYHAFRAVLDYVIGCNSRRIWKAYFDGVVDDLTKYYDKRRAVRGYGQHYLALAKVCRLKRFREYAKQYGYDKEIRKIARLKV